MPPKENYRTPEQQQAFNHAQVELAFSEGKKIESSQDGVTWTDCYHPSWVWSCKIYRVKHEPRYVPLEYGDIMPGDWIRLGKDEKALYRVLSIYPSGHIETRDYTYSFENMFKNKVEYSKDSCQTWNLCRKVAK